MDQRNRSEQIEQQREHPETTHLKLKAIDKDIVDADDRALSVYLHLKVEDKLPIELGTGRSAVVLFATLFPDLQNPGNIYYAVKFLRDDPDPQYSEASAQRFFTEAEQMQKWGRTGGTIVGYHGWGAIAKNTDLKDTRGGVREFWWHDYFSKYDLPPDKEASEPLALTNNGPEFARIKRALNFQGPFYIIELCQGTLEDLLEGDSPWSELPAYEWIDGYKSALDSELHEAKQDVEIFREHYLDPKHPQASGYDILNSFKREPVEIISDPRRPPVVHNPNQIRNHAVLQLFNQMVEAVASLHRGSVNKRTGAPPLAHRDIKPGNIFLQHPSNRLNDLSIRLSDLGYVIEAPKVQKGETLLGDHRGAEYQAPGSQFYRAPEQAELPIEVRVNVKQPRNLVHVKGTKLSNITINDWLLIDDLIREKGAATSGHPDGEQRKFKITSVNRIDQDVYELKLERAVPGSRDHSLHAQVIKSSGFHSDGYSLGAILYDLASGGKNPEHFYTYCLRVFTPQFTTKAKSEKFDDVETITEVLAPRDKEEFEARNRAEAAPGEAVGDAAEPVNGSFGPPSTIPLTGMGRLKIGTAATTAPDTTQLLDRIVAALYVDANAQESSPANRASVKPLTLEGRKQVALAALAATNADHLLALIIDSLFPQAGNHAPPARALEHAPTRSLAIESRKNVAITAINATNADQVLDRVIDSLYHDLGEDERKRKIRDLRFRKFHVVDDLLRDKRDEFIPREIIKLIVRCMLRDIPGAFYQSDPKEAYASEDNIKAAGRISDAVKELLLLDEFGLPKEGFSFRLRENMLYKLRSLMHVDAQDAGSADASFATRSSAATVITPPEDMATPPVVDQPDAPEVAARKEKDVTRTDDLYSEAQSD